MKKGNVFSNGWLEAPVDFAPTYKYNNNSQIYDTSEKVCIYMIPLKKYSYDTTEKVFIFSCLISYHTYLLYLSLILISYPYTYLIETYSSLDRSSVMEE
jgi:hypothetical protein